MKWNEYLCSAPHQLLKPENKYEEYIRNCNKSQWIICEEKKTYQNLEDKKNIALDKIAVMSNVKFRNTFNRICELQGISGFPKI